ncbi:MAG: inositol monophosphatase [Amycolatopsis sp.]|uniref:inositol monophosphatase family protein n=1 Tax=Amycolatopsis sp. TaxID=37632 RepID=UPI002604FC32|nr:inositol monophosphatase family protein [Amycolatopsis sp.]MCU1681720.1 inositol monophosphatase [Amycolatopsis sp.]
MKDLSELLVVAQDAADIGRRLMTTSSPGQVHAKGDRDLVTDLDLQIQHDVKAYLEQVTPDIDFLGEEDGGGELDQDADYVWALDPIDGTSNFAHGIPLCATQLALIHRGEPVVGVIDAPFLELNYHATKGGGSFCNGRPIHASATSDLSRAIVSIGDYTTGPQAAAKNKHRFAVTQDLVESVERVRMFGSAALDLAFVADGRTDACVILANKPWDTGAGVLILRQSGGIVSNIKGDRHNFDSSSTVGTNSRVKLPIS